MMPRMIPIVRLVARLAFSNRFRRAVMIMTTIAPLMITLFSFNILLDWVGDI